MLVPIWGMSQSADWVPFCRLGPSLQNGTGLAEILQIGTIFLQSADWDVVRWHNMLTAPQSTDWVSQSADRML